MSGNLSEVTSPKSAVATNVAKENAAVDTAK